METGGAFIRRARSAAVGAGSTTRWRCLRSGLPRALGLLLLVVCISPAKVTGLQAGPSIRSEIPAIFDTTGFAAAAESSQVLILSGNYEAAESLATSLIRKAVRDSGEGSTHHLDCLVLWLQAKIQNGQGADAEVQRLAEMQYELVQKDPRASAQDVGYHRSILASVLVSSGQFARAAAMLRKSIEADSTGYWAATYFSTLGEIQYRQLDLGGALSSMKRAIELFHSSSRHVPLIEASCRVNLGALLIALGRTPAAMEEFTEARRICDSASTRETPILATVLFSIGSAYGRMGDYREAEALLEGALAIQERMLRPDHPDIGLTVNNLAILAGESGDLDRAWELLKRALRIAQMTYGSKNKETARALTNLAQFHVLLGDYGEAEELFKQLLSMQEGMLGPDHLEVARSLDGFGDLYVRMGKLEPGKRMLLRALAIRMQHQHRNHPDLVPALNNLANVLLEEGSPDSAWTMFVRAREVDEKSGEGDKSRRAVLLRTGASILLAQGNAGAALSLIQEAIGAIEQVLPASHPDAADALGLLGRILMAEGRSDSAVAAVLRAAAMQRQHLRLALRFLPERQGLQYSGSGQRWLGVAISMATRLRGPSPGRELLDELIRSRAIVQDEMGIRHRALREASNPLVRALRDSLASAGERLAYLYLSQKDGDSISVQKHLHQMDVASRDRERLEVALAARSVEVRRARSEQTFGADALARALPAGCSSISYYRARDLEIRSAHGGVGGTPSEEYVAFVLQSGHTEPALVPLGSANRIDSLVSEWRVLALAPRNDLGVRLQEKDCERAGIELRMAIWDPVWRMAGNPVRVFLVPDGTLDLVSFDALPSGKQRFLAEENVVFHYLSAERDLLRADSEGVLASGMLALGAPDFDHVDRGADASPIANLALVGDADRRRSAELPCADLASSKFRALPDAALEAREVVKIWKSAIGAPAGTTPDASDPTALILGRFATERAFKKLAPGRRIIHVATHAFFQDEFCTPRAAASAGAGPEARPRPAASLAGGRVDPLLLSGLVFAGANKRDSSGSDTNDGMLTAEEIGALDLTGTEWVVLSACGTNLGPMYAGEGVLGLRRSFQISGARTMIASLWPVEDYQTRLWMGYLYRAHFRGGQTTMDSVRSANLAVLRRLRRSGLPTLPSAWGGFLASGSWR